jgi:predicted nucleic acid-binding protein
MAVLLDSGFLFAALNAAEAEHLATVRVLESIRESIVLPVPAITEVAYLLARDIGQAAASDFVASLATTELTLEIPLEADYSRSAEILRQYSDANVDFVDALIVAIAERLKITRLLTLDRRDFHLIRPKHCTSFELLP